MPEITKNQLKHIRLLKQKKYRQQFGEFVVEGEKNVAELLNSSYSVSSIFAIQGWDGSSLQHEVISISAKQLSQVSNLSTPDKVIAIAKIPETDSSPFSWKQGICLCLESINDPGNLGTIIRTADWYGVNTIICSPNSVDCFNPKVVQATKGSIFNTRIIYSHLEKVFGANKIPVYGAVLDGNPLNKDSSIDTPAFLVMGSESHGISDSLTPFLTEKISIQKIGKAESLNVAIATSILLHQFLSK